MRCFVAINLPEDIKSRLQSVQERLSPLVTWKPVERENLHVTLKFLGEVDDHKLNRIEETLMEVSSAQEPFVMELKGAGAFPNLNYIRVLWIGIDKGSNEIRQLMARIDSKLAGLGFSKEREYVPHVTIGRVKAIMRRGELAQAIRSLQELSFGSAEVKSIALMKSTLTSKGPIYNILKELPLGGN